MNPFVLSAGVIVVLIGAVAWLITSAGPAKSRSSLALSESAARRANIGLIVWMASWLVASGIVVVGRLFYKG